MTKLVNIAVTSSGFLCFFWSWGTVMSLGMFFSHFRDEYQLTDADTALVQALTSSFIQFFALMVGILLYFSPCGRPFWFMILGSGLVATGYWGAAASSSFTQLAVSAAIGWGVGSSFLTVATVALLPSYFSQEFQHRRQTATSIMTAGSGIGGLLLPFLFEHLLDNHDARAALNICGWVVAVTLIPTVCIFWIPPTDAITLKTLTCHALKDRRVPLLTLGSVVFYFSYFSLNIYLAPFAQDQLQMSTEQVGYALSTIGVTSTIGRLMAGFIADATKEPLRMWMVGMSLKAIAAVLMVMSTQRWLFWVAVVLGGVGHSFGIFLNQVVSHHFPREFLPSVYGFVYCLSGLGSLFGPYALGKLIADYDYLLGMLLMQLTLIPGLAALIALRDVKPLEEETSLNAT
jgi:MFS family permease